MMSTAASVPFRPPESRQSRPDLDLHRFRSGLLRAMLSQKKTGYVNTRVLQTVLAEPEGAGRMSPEDYRGLTPLIYSYVNPYVRFDLDLDSRIDFGRLAA